MRPTSLAEEDRHASFRLPANLLLTTGVERGAHTAIRRVKLGDDGIW